MDYISLKIHIGLAVKKKKKKKKCLAQCGLGFFEPKIFGK